MQGKKIILPCDQEWSELYKACLAKGLDCEIGQDMWNTDYSKYDLVFTNPPFHGLYKWIRYLNNNNVKYLLFAPWAIIGPCADIKHDFYNKVYYIEDFRNNNHTIFKTQNGDNYAVHWGLITNLEEGKALVEAKPDIRIQPTNEFQNYKGIWLDLISCNYLKYDYIDWHSKKLKVKIHEERLEKIELWN